MSKADIYSGLPISTDGDAATTRHATPSNKRGREQLAAAMLSHSAMYRDAGPVPVGIRGTSACIIAIDGLDDPSSSGETP